MIIGRLAMDVYLNTEMDGVWRSVRVGLCVPCVSRLSRVGLVSVDVCMCDVRAHVAVGCDIYSGDRCGVMWASCANVARTSLSRENGRYACICCSPKLSSLEVGETDGRPFLTSR